MSNSDSYSSARAIITNGLDALDGLSLILADFIGTTSNQVTGLLKHIE